MARARFHRRTELRGAEILADQNVVLGPHLVLIDSHVTATARMRCSYVAMVDCVIDGKFKRGTFWHGCTFIRCSFKGELDGHVFGPKAPGKLGGMQSCDFSACDLHECFFYMDSLASNQWPAWPSFAVRSGPESARALDESGAWSETLLVTTLDVVWEPQPWVVYDARKLTSSRARQAKMKRSLKQLGDRAVFVERKRR